MNQHTSLAPVIPLEDAGHESDLVLWFERQAELLRTKNFEQLDLVNLIEELEAMGRRDRRELASRLEVLMMHLLECLLQPERRSSSWIGTILEQRSEIGKLLDESPSLRQYVAPFADKVYPAAVERAAIQTGLPAAAFPANNPFSPQDLLDPVHLP